MSKLNVMQTIENPIGKINPHYEMSSKDLEEIRVKSLDLFNMAVNCFRFGYMQRMKAECARQRKMNKESETRK